MSLKEIKKSKGEMMKGGGVGEKRLTKQVRAWFWLANQGASTGATASSQGASTGATANSPGASTGATANSQGASTGATAYSQEASTGATVNSPGASTGATASSQGASTGATANSQRASTIIQYKYNNNMAIILISIAGKYIERVGKIIFSSERLLQGGKLKAPAVN